MKKHFVVFFSPGTFVAEQTQKEIDSWDVEKAKKMARTIKERYGAIPYGFQFITRERKDTDLDSKESKRSGMYFLGGVIWTLASLKARNDPKDRVLILNMETNHWNKVVVNNNSYTWAQILKGEDVVLEFKA
jgi:hypothetical protein